MQRLSLSFILLCFMALLSAQAGAQPLHVSATAPLMPDVLGPAPRVWWIGPQIGGNITTHSGDVLTKNCNCLFEGC